MEETDKIDITLNIRTYVKQDLLDLVNSLWKKLDKQHTGFILVTELPRMLRLLGKRLIRFQSNRKNAL